MEAGKHVDILLFLGQLCLFGVFSVTILFFVKAYDKWSISGSGKWKFGGKIMWLKWWKVGSNVNMSYKIK